MKTETIEYRADGARMLGFLALDDGVRGARPGVLVAHAAPGLGESPKDRALRLAGLGYVAFAVDYVGDGRVSTDGEQIWAMVHDFEAHPTRLHERLQAGLAVLTARPETDRKRLGAIGYCFGGTAVLELARYGAPLKGVVGFHSGLKTSHPEDARHIKGKVLVCLGAEDPIIPAAQRQAFEEEMRAGGVDWQINLYGGTGHSFTDPRIDAFNMPGMRYHRQSDERSWRAMQEFFTEVFATADQ
jgi:dienelactone hydrolase